MDFSIGELSRRTHVKVPTVRFYEQIGLLPEPPRTQGQQRRYDRSHEARLNFIRHSRELGFDVEAIRELLAMSSQPNRSCSEIDDLARRHIVEVDRRISHLQSLRAELQRMVDACGKGTVCECRVVEALSDGSHHHGKIAAL